MTQARAKASVCLAAVCWRKACGWLIEGAQHTEDRLAIVERSFRAEGIALERPWLNPGYADAFAAFAVRGEAA